MSVVHFRQGEADMNVLYACLFLQLKKIRSILSRKHHSCYLLNGRIKHIFCRK